jgi:hypothetical protein
MVERAGPSPRPQARWALIAALFTMIAVSAALALASRAEAKVEAHEFEVTRSTSQAGGHPDVTFSFKPDNWDSPPGEDLCQCRNPKDINLELPTGLIGNPHATPQCTAAQFIRRQCPSDTQIGEVILTSDIGGSVLGPFSQALFNMVPKANQAGLVAWRIPVFEAPIYTVLDARTGGDYGLNVAVEGIQQKFVLTEIEQQLWGVPADASHDFLREGIPNEESKTGVPSQSPLAPFLSNPTTCGVPLSTSIRILSYDTEETESNWPWTPTTGCDQLTFNPSLSAQPTTTATDSPSGLEVDLSVPQEESPSTPSPSELRAASVTLPEGFSLNPNAADGKTACTDAEARFGTTEEAQCPEFSKIGTDTLESSALPGPIRGSIYIGEPLPDDRYRLILTADGFATHVKLAGSARPDPETGRLTVAFENLPQSPLTNFNLHFFGSERGILATPTKCGTYAVHSIFTPWDGALQSQEASQLFTLAAGPGGAPCPGTVRPFGPSFQAASASNTAGKYTPFSIELAREDGDQNLTGLTVKAPPGLAASFSGVPYCPEAAIAQLGLGYSGLTEQASPLCPAASQVGTVAVSAGAGSHPLNVSGKAYLAGPYKGAPLSLLAVIPAVSGPYDLGTVAVRVAVHVDSLTAQATTVSDPLPQILAGIPLRLRSILVTLDRPNFTLNPTNCDPFAVAATIDGDEGGVANATKQFQVANCANLPYRPRISLTLSGGLNRLGHPAIHTVLEAAPGEANSKAIAVTLPKGELLDNSHISGVCTKVDFAANTCPAGSKIGHAEVLSPLLENPLNGNVYLRSSSHGLPDLALDLEGQFDIEAIGRVDSVNQRYRATFPAIPDVPVSRIVVDLAGGHKGLLQNSEGICGKARRAAVSMTAQNGAELNRRTKLSMACRANDRHRRHRGTTQVRPGR